MEIMRNGEVTRRVQNTLRRMIIAALKWTLLIVAFATDSCFHWTGQDAVGYGDKSYTHSTQMAKYSDRNYSPLLAKQENPCRPSRHELSQYR